MKIKYLILALMVVAVSSVTAWLFYYNSDHQRALRFIESNIEGHNWVDRYLTDHKGIRQDFDPYKYSTLYTARDTLDSLNTLYVSNTDVYNDNDVINADSLSLIISRALALRKSSPYTKNLSFDEFCEYLLPYRAGSEKLSDFADTIRNRYARMLRDSSASDPIRAASIINNDMKKWIKFDLRSHALLSEPSVDDLMTDSLGSCRALSALFVQIMRTMGIPAAMDECPVWAHRNSGHQWTVVRDVNGIWRPFEPAEFNPDGFRAISENTKTPKIYRNTYSFNHEFYPHVNKNDIPANFLTFNREDVTSEYVSVSDVYVTADLNLDQSNDILYLAVFNSDRWVPVSWAAITDGGALFKEMGNNNIVYLPVFYRNGHVIPAASPFILSDGGKKQFVMPDKKRLRTLNMSFHNLYWTTVWDTFASSRLGRPVELYYWDNQWILCDVDTIDSDPITHFERVPANGLYIMRWKDLANTWQRPFMADSTSDNSSWF